MEDTAIDASTRGSVMHQDSVGAGGVEGKGCTGLSSEISCLEGSLTQVGARGEGSEYNDAVPL